jgi:hypothetical protein
VLLEIENRHPHAPFFNASCGHPESLLTVIKHQGYGAQSGQQAGYGQFNPYEQQQDNRYEGYGNQGGYTGNAQPYSTRPEPQQTNSSYYGDPEAGAAGSHGMSRSADIMLLILIDVQR